MLAVLLIETDIKMNITLQQKAKCSLQLGLINCQQYNIKTYTPITFWPPHTLHILTVPYWEMLEIVSFILFISNGTLHIHEHTKR